MPGLRDVNKDMSGFLTLCLTTPLSLFLWFCVAFSRLNKMNSLFLPCDFNTFPVAESILCIYSGFRDASAETFNQILLGLGGREHSALWLCIPVLKIPRVAEQLQGVRQTGSGVLKGRNEMQVFFLPGVLKENNH